MHGRSLLFQAQTQLRCALEEAGLAGDAEFVDRNRHKWPVLKACLAAGLYPNLVRDILG